MAWFSGRNTGVGEDVGRSALLLKFFLCTCGRASWYFSHITVSGIFVNCRHKSRFTLKYLLLLFLLSPLGLCAQTDSLGSAADTLARIPFIAYWSTGDVYKFDVQKIDIRTKNGAETKNDTSSYTGVFEVMDSTETDYRIKWSFEGSSPLAGALDKSTISALNDAEIYEVIYVTDELGTFRQIENMEELQRSAGKTIEALLAGPLKEMPDSARMMMEPLLRSMTTPAFIESNLLPELKLLHYPYGVEFVEGDTITYEEEIPNPFGGNSMQATSTLYVDSLDVADDFIHLKQFMNMDESDVTELLRGVFESMGMKQEKPREVINEAIFKIRNDNDYYFYYYPGIPIYIDYFREIETKIDGDEGSRIIRTLIEWVE